MDVNTTSDTLESLEEEIEGYLAKIAHIDDWRNSSVYKKFREREQVWIKLRDRDKVAAEAALKGESNDQQAEVH